MAFFFSPEQSSDSTNLSPWNKTLKLLLLSIKLKFSALLKSQKETFYFYSWLQFVKSIYKIKWPFWKNITSTRNQIIHSVLGKKLRDPTKYLNIEIVTIVNKIKLFRHFWKIDKELSIFKLASICLAKIGHHRNGHLEFFEDPPLKIVTLMM